MPYHIDEENSELAFEVREGNKLVIKIKSNIFSDSLELYLIKVGDNTEPTDKNVFSSLRVLKEIENLHDTILKEINSVTSGFWELKQDSQGNEYISTKYNVLTEGGLTTYGLGEQKLGTIYDGLPIDNDTIYWEEVEGSRVLKAKGSGGGSTGLDETKLWNVLGTPGDQQIDYSHLRSAFSQFSNNFVTINTEQEITALKHFTAGLSVGSAKKKIYEKDGVLYIDSNVAITGALTMYATDGQSVSSIYDGLPIDNDTIYWETVEESRVLKAKGGSSFDENAMWSALSGSSDNQINKSHLTTALDGYATQNWVIENYATKSELSAVSNKLNDFLEGSDTDNIINKWKELEAFLSGMAETDNLAEILETKADKKYVDSTFVTLATKQTITGEKTFFSVLNTAAIKASGAITAPSLAASDWVTIAGIKLRKLEDGALMLEGNLALTGALTMYASNGQSFDTIYDGLPIDNDTIYWQEVDGSRVLKAREGSGSSFDKSAMWTALAGSTTEQINKSHLTTALDGYATQNWVIENYATKSELSAVSNKLNDFLEGSDTDNIINKWKELEAFLSGMAETDNLAEILETKADKKYVDSTFVTLATKQTITGEKTFFSVLNTAAIKASGAITAPSLAASDWVTIAGIKLRKLEDGALMLEGNLALTGALTMYASNGQSFDTIYDGLPIDNDTIYWQEVDGSRVLKAREGSGSSFDKSAMWTALAGSTTEQINKSHLTTALTGYATESWVSGKNYAVKATTLAGYGITDAYTKKESDGKYPTKTGSGASGTWGIGITGNAATASKWATARTITLGSYLSGSVSLDGSANVTLNANVLGLTSQGNKTAATGNTSPASGVRLYQVYNNGYPTPYGNLLSVKGGGAGELLLSWNNANRIYYRSLRDNGDNWLGWNELAFITDNVASATKLQTTRKLWGRPFDGTADVGGDMTGVGWINGGLRVDYGDDLVGLRWRGVHTIEFGGNTGYAHTSYYFRPSYSSSGLTEVSLTIQNASASNTPTFTTTHSFNSYGVGYHKYGLGVGRSAPNDGYAGGIYASTILANDWFRSEGNTGWINQTYSGGWYMSDTYFIRCYGEKSVYLGSGSYRNGGGGYVANNLTNASDIYSCRFMSEGVGAIPAGNIRNILGWYDSAASGWQTSYIIGCVRNYNNNWGEMRLGVYQYEGSNRAAKMFISLDGANNHLYVEGNLLVTGGVTLYGSDIRYKSIIQQVKLSLSDIAKAPSFVYHWNREGMKCDRLNIGGSAQYTKTILPWAVEEKTNLLTMDYATVAYTFAVHAARHLLTYETRTDKKIKKLENRVKYLEKQLKKLGYEEVRTLDDQSV